MKKISDFKVGDIAQIVHEITQEDVKKFVDLTGDDNKLHVDKAFAASTAYKKPVAHGMLGASFISTIIGTKIPGDGALWYFQQLEFLLPVRVGDVLTIIAEIKKISESNNSLELSTNIYNQNKQKVVSGLSKVKLVEEATESVATDSEVKRENALVIGGSGGIGQATCIRLSKAGFNIALHYHTNSVSAEETVAQCRKYGVTAYAFKGDIGQPKEIDNLVFDVARKFDSIDVVVNCTTIKVPAMKFEACDWEDYQKHIDINIKSSFYVVKAFLKQLLERKKGKFIGITTQYTESTPPNDLSPYVTAKYALNGFYKSLAVEYAPKGLTFNLVSPGMTETELIADLPEKVRLITSAKTPLKRLATPADVANTIAFLAGNDSGFITGETIRVNGGQSMI